MAKIKKNYKVVRTKSKTGKVYTNVYFWDEKTGRWIGKRELGKYFELKKQRLNENITSFEEYETLYKEAFGEDIKALRNKVRRLGFDDSVIDYNIKAMIKQYNKKGVKITMNLITKRLTNEYNPETLFLNTRNGGIDSYVERYYYDETVERRESLKAQLRDINNYADSKVRIDGNWYAIEKRYNEEIFLHIGS